MTEEQIEAVEQEASTGSDSIGDAFDEAFDKAADEVGYVDDLDGDDVPAEAEASAETPSEGEETPEAPEDTSPPAHWDADRQKLWLEATPDQQRAMSETYKAMEAAHTKRSQEIAPLRQVAEEWTPYLEQIGDSPDRYFGELAQLERGLRTGTNDQRIQTLANLAEFYGVDFAAYGGAQPQQDPRQDPLGIQAAIQEAVAPYQQQAQLLAQQQAAQEQAAQQQHQAQMTEQVEAHRNAVGEDGSPLYPHFGEVEGDMAMLAQARMAQGQSFTIPDLYQQACWVNDGVRAKIQLEQQHKQNQARVVDNQKRQVAAGGLSGGGGNPTESQPKSFDEAFDAAWATMASG